MTRSITLLAMLSACAPVALQPEGNDLDQVGRFEADEEETDLVLLAANTLSYVELDDDVGLDSRAATNIHEQRPFRSLEELDAVSYVGASALKKLLDYAEEHLAAPGDDDDDLGPDVHGIAEGSLDATALLDFVNTASESELDDDVGLDRRAAGNIVDDRPFATLAELDEVSYVGASAFEALATYLDLGGDCPAGQVYSSDGDWYSSLTEALSHSSTFAVLDVCPGEHPLFSSSIQRAITIRGDRDAVITGDIITSVGPVTFEGLAIEPESITVNPNGKIVLDDVRVVGDDDLLVDVRSLGSMEAIHSTFEGGRISIGGNVDFTEVTLDAVGPSDGRYWALQLVNAQFTMTGGAIINSPQVGVYAYSGRGEFQGVDFGRGGSENGTDINARYGTDYTWLHEDSWVTCDNGVCEEI